MNENNRSISLEMNIMNLPDELLYTILRRSLRYERDESTQENLTYTKMTIVNKQFNKMHQNKKTKVRHEADDIYGFYLFT